MDLPTETLMIAQSQLGVTEHPAGSNRGPQVDQYIRAAGLDPTKGAYAWCASFVTWCVRSAATDLAITPLFRGSPRALGLVNRNPALIIAAPAPNCIAVMDHGGGLGHAFFVTAVSPDGSQLSTLEGNSDVAGSRTGGAVVLRTRATKDIAHFFRIA